MKHLKVTVNGTTYDVSVEEVGSTAAPVASSPAAAPVAAPVPAAAPATGEAVTAPMPGVILSVAVTAGQNVKKGDVLCTLEAMKMENEIFAPRDGVVAAVSVAKGESVESGKTLVTLS